MKTFRSTVLALYLALLLAACTARNSVLESSPERFRPVLHFTPPVNWMNDPNGLLYSGGKYHMFYQYNPYGAQWGHMSWGHAVSANLYDWIVLPVALAEENEVMIFSGSAVIDPEHSCPVYDQRKYGMIAIYTSHRDGISQSQSLAWSVDSGYTWTKYAGNPVLDPGVKDFRDPKVFPYNGEWRMVVSLPPAHRVQFYKSKDLLHWNKTGEFGNKGDTSRIWECPDLVKAPVAGTKDQYKWVLIISSGNPGGKDFTGMQYFTGNFDGNRFIRDERPELPLWLDYGKDFYAAVTFNNLPEGDDPVMIGWVNNWRYAGDIPTKIWRGMMSSPRRLRLISIGDGFYLAQEPVIIPDHFMGKTKWVLKDLILNNRDSEAWGIREKACLIDAEIINKNARKFGIRVFCSQDHATTIGIDPEAHTYYVDRTKSGYTGFNSAFPSQEMAPVKILRDTINIRVILDHSVTEVFADNGATVITDQVFPEENGDKIIFFAEGGESLFKKISVRNFVPGNH